MASSTPRRAPRARAGRSTSRPTCTCSSTRSGWPRARSRPPERATAAVPRSVAEQLAQDVRQDAAVAEVERLLGRVDPHAGPELLVAGAHGHLARRGPARVQRLRDAEDLEL